MAKRSVDQRFYSKNQIGKIIAAGGGLPDGDIEHKRRPDGASDLLTVRVPRREALAERLERTASAWHFEKQRQSKPTAKKQANAYKAIQTASADLLTALQLSANEHSPDILAEMPPALRDGGLRAFAGKEAERLGGLPLHSGEGLLRDAVLGVHRLRRWAEAGERLKRRHPLTPRGRPTDAALNSLFTGLLGIWVEVFGGLHTVTNPTTGDSAGRPEGPFIDFMTACMAPLLHDEAPSPTAIYDRVQNLLPSVSAMAKLGQKKVNTPIR